MRRFFLILWIIVLGGCDGFGDLSDVEYISRAEEFLDKGDLRSAAIELKNALTMNSENAKARWLLGKLHTDIGNGPAAEKELKKARELGVVEESVAPLLAKAYLLQGKYEEVLKLGKADSFSSGAAADLLAARGMAYFAKRRVDKAKAELDEALQRDSKSVYALVGKARLSASDDDIVSAHEFLHQALQIDETYAAAWSFRGDLTSHEGKLEAAIESYTKAITNRFNNTSDLQKRALTLIRLERDEEAQKDVDLLKKRIPKYEKVIYLQGLIHLHQKRWPEARESFEQTLQVNNDYMPAVYFLGITLYRQGNIKQADEYLSRFVRFNPNFIPSRKLLSQIKMRKKEFKEAEMLIRPVLNAAKKDDVEALNLLAGALLEQGKSAEAIKLLEKIVAIQPDSALAKTRLGLGLLMEGEKESGYEAIESAIELDSEFQQPNVLLILHYLSEDLVDEARKAAEAFVTRQPDNATAYNLLGMAYIAGDQNELAEEVLQHARRIAPGDPSACNNLATLALQKSQPALARELYREVLNHNDKHLDTLLRLAALEARQGERKQAKEVLNQAIVAHPEAIQPKILLAKAYLQEGQPERVFVILGDVREKRETDPIVLTTIAEAQLALKEYINAKITLNFLIALQPNSPQAHFLMAKALNGLNDLQGVEHELEQALELEPDHIPSQIALAHLFLSSGDITKARQGLDSLQRSGGKKRPDVVSLEGAILVRSGQTEKALAIYQDLFVEHPNTENLFALTQLQWTLGEREEALSQMEDWQKDHPDDVIVRLARANAYLGMGQEDKAMGLYQRVLELSENDLLALNNLAWYLRETNPDQALVFAEKAASINPDSSLIMDTLAVILLQQGETRRARRLVERALEQQPENPTFLFHRAWILETIGENQQAESELKALLLKNKYFPERVEAEQMLQRLTGDS